MASDPPAAPPALSPGASPPRRWIVPATLFALAALIVFWQQRAAEKEAPARSIPRAQPAPTASPLPSAAPPAPGEEESSVRSMAQRAAEQVLPTPAALGGLDFELFVPRSQLDDRFAALTAKALDLGGKAVPGLPTPNRKLERRLNVSLAPARVGDFRAFAGAPPLPASPLLSADDTQTLEYFEVTVRPTE